MIEPKGYTPERISNALFEINIHISKRIFAREDTIRKYAKDNLSYASHKPTGKHKLSYSSGEYKLILVNELEQLVIGLGIPVEPERLREVLFEQWVDYVEKKVEARLEKRLGRED